MKFLLILIFFSLLLFKIDNYPIKPVIGIYGNSEPENGDEKFINGTYYPLSYIYWLESAGAEVMAIHYWYSYGLIDEILQKINGILFLGGGRLLIKEGTWEIKAKYIIEQSLKLEIPFWGTCQGFQLIATILSDDFTLLKHEFDDINVLHNIDTNNNTRKSNMFKLFTPYEFELLSNTNSTIYNHEWGFYPNEYYENKNLEEMTIVTSISEDYRGSKFINTYEGKKNKFYGVQFHPEKNPFKRRNYYVEQNIEALKVSQKLLLNFVHQTRNNKNKFEEDRAKFDFFNTYNGTKNCVYSKEEEICYFYKKE